MSGIFLPWVFISVSYLLSVGDTYQPVNDAHQLKGGIYPQGASPMELGWHISS